MISTGFALNLNHSVLCCLTAKQSHVFTEWLWVTNSCTGIRMLTEFKRLTCTDELVKNKYFTCMRLTIYRFSGVQSVKLIKVNITCKDVDFRVVT